MFMIYVTGDVHGDIDFEKLYKLRDYNVNYNDTLIILGDAGICWSSDFTKYILDRYENICITVIFVDGNHENFDMLDMFPIVEYHGALMHQINEHIFHVLRGEILEIEGFSMLCIGGAHSIDKYLRTPHISWWPQEDITKHDIDNAKWNLSKHNNKVDLVLTHCCDTFTVTKYFHFSKDKNTDMLNFIDENISYRYWLFGHYHFDRTIGNTKLCLYQNIL